MFFAYRSHLEGEVEELKERIKDLEAKNWELVKALMPQPIQVVAKTAEEIVKSKRQEHKITKGDNSASCTCDWHFASNDPASLQDAIQQHHAATTISLRARKSWATVRGKLEQHSEELSIKEN